MSDWRVGLKRWALGWRWHFRDYAGAYLVAVVAVIATVLKVRATQAVDPTLPWWVALFSEIRVVPR